MGSRFFVGAPTFALVHRVRDVVEVDVERPEHPGPTPRVLVGGPAKGVYSDQRLHSGSHAVTARPACPTTD
jgi:hypothetical protein